MTSTASPSTTTSGLLYVIVITSFLMKKPTTLLAVVVGLSKTLALQSGSALQGQKTRRPYSQPMYHMTIVTRLVRSNSPLPKSVPSGLHRSARAMSWTAAKSLAKALSANALNCASCRSLLQLRPSESPPDRCSQHVRRGTTNAACRSIAPNVAPRQPWGYGQWLPWFGANRLPEVAG